MLRHNILLAVFLKQLPFLRGVVRLVPGAVPVGPGGLTGDTEVPDQGLAYRKLLLVLGQADGLSGGIQPGRIPAVQAVYHGTAPLLQRCFIARPVQAVPLKCRIVRMLDYSRIAQHPQDTSRYRFPTGKVYDLYRKRINLVSEQEDPEIRGLGVFIEPCLANIHAAACFNVYAQMVFYHVFLLSG